MSIRPLHDKVLIRRAKQETTSKGGIILADNSQEKPSEGMVIAVGSGKRLKDGTRATPDVEVGQKVIFGKYAGSEVKVDSEELLMMSEEDIMGIIE